MMNKYFAQTLIADSAKVITDGKLQMYEPLIGSWNFEWFGYQNGEQMVESYLGEWHFSWILEGRAIQDNWICPCRQLKNRGKNPEGQYGTTLRFYDPAEDRVKIFWLAVGNPQHALFYSEYVDGIIVQREIYPAKPLHLARAWLFEDITQHSFVWKCVDLVDGHELLTQKLFAQRINHKPAS